MAVDVTQAAILVALLVTVVGGLWWIAQES